MEALSGSVLVEEQFLAAEKALDDLLRDFETSPGGLAGVTGTDSSRHRSTLDILSLTGTLSPEQALDPIFVPFFDVHPVCKEPVQEGLQAAPPAGFSPSLHSNPGDCSKYDLPTLGEASLGASKRCDAGGAASAAGGAARGAAQRRFRQRQKDSIQQLQHQLAEKLQLVQQLAAENQGLRVKAQVLEQAVSCCDDQISILRNCTLEGGTLALPQGGVGRAVVQLQSLSPAEVSRRWKLFVQEASSLLVQLERQQRDPALLERLGRLVQGTGSLCHHVALLCGGVMTQVVAMNMDKLVLEAPRDPEHYTRLYHALALSPAQRQSLAAFQQVYSATMAPLLREVQRIKAQLEQLDGGVVPSLLLCQSLSDPSTSTTRAMELAEELGASLRKQDAACIMLTFFFFRHTLSAEQIARVATLAYPYFPDAFMLVQMAAEQVAGLRGGAQQAGAVQGQ